MVAVLLAAGRSRRFGRPKQLEPLGPTGETLLDYALYDAAAAGFGDRIVVTSEELLPRLRDHLGGRRDAPTLVVQPRPLGTADAVLCAAPHVSHALAVANADDWYGPGAWARLAAHLRSDPDEAAAVSYAVGGTLSPHGGVSRARLELEGERVVGVEECLELRADGAGRIRGRTPAGTEVALPPDTPISMNLWGLPPAALSTLARLRADWLRRPEPTDEFGLSTAMDTLVRTGETRCRRLEAPDAWFGLTFDVDREAAVARLEALHAAGAYPTPLV